MARRAVRENRVVINVAKPESGDRSAVAEPI